MADTSLDSLCVCIRPKIDELLSRTRSELQMEPVVINTMRDEATQAQNIAHGVSFTKASKHLPQRGCGKAHACDIAPKHLILLKNWAPEHPDWLRLGTLAESLGLHWGGRWAGKFHRPGDPDSRSPDCPHFDLPLVHTQNIRVEKPNVEGPASAV